MDTITALIEQSCRRFSTRVALLHKSGGIWRTTSYGKIGEISGRIAAGMSHNGFQPGSHAALLAPSSPEWVMAYLGILKAGGVVIPIDRELKNIELSHVMAHCQAEVIFSDNDHLGTLLAMLEELPALRMIVIIDSPAGQKIGRAHV